MNPPLLLVRNAGTEDTVLSGSANLKQVSVGVPPVVATTVIAKKLPMPNALCPIPKKTLSSDPVASPCVTSRIYDRFLRRYPANGTQ
ncbi:hypothetical protein H6G41_26175 [Tolypothrix sp. FACHB-123]|uniref:hypothetical protein n=1 Tax=Tolypothrix sp. FACHB-123 TaxID=2692868 RepID=UPI0016833257|nr:hypothetical protein [Tolypothrix sp. FACHB-123]MBD2358057.1 hypothetical protein [Tolypothrix sp. FACHB-123]